LETFTKGLLVSCLLLIPLSLTAETLYRWTDANGRMHISDKIPPEATRQAYDVLNSQGRVVRHVDAPLTEAERAAQEAAQLKEQEATRARKEQERKDRILTLTYGSVEEIEFTRDERLSLIKSQMLLHEKRLREKDAELEAMNRKTQRYSDEDRPVPEGLLKRERRLMEEQAALLEMLRIGEVQYQSLNERFLLDIRRFNELQKQKAQSQ
jgi:uncharacterized Rmd1/YagE family protein